MKEQIAAVVEDLRSNPRVASFDEAGVKQAIILRLLVALGWDQYNVNEVMPEYGVSGGKVDYVLRLAGENKVFVEVKRAGEQLGLHQEQLLNYSFKHGVKLAVLTNGITWWFYLPLREGNWEQRKFYGADIKEHGVLEIASRFVDLLSRNEVLSGAAFKNAENLLDSLQRERVIQVTLPKAWRRLVSDPDSLLVDLLEETVEKICGLKPEPASIRRFLAEGAALLPASIENVPTVRKVKPTRPSAGQDSKDSSLNQTLSIPADRFRGKSIVGFTFDGKPFEVTKWKDLLITLSEEVHRRHVTEFDKVRELRGTTRKYFSRDKRELHAPKRVGNSGYYCGTQLSAEQIVRLCYRLLFLFSYSQQDLTVQIG